MNSYKYSLVFIICVCAGYCDYMLHPAPLRAADELIGGVPETELSELLELTPNPLGSEVLYGPIYRYFIVQSACQRLPIPEAQICEFIGPVNL